MTPRPSRFAASPRRALAVLAAATLAVGVLLVPTSAQAETPFVAPVVGEVTPTSVELVWTPAVAEFEVIGYDVLVFEPASETELTKTRVGDPEQTAVTALAPVDLPADGPAEQLGVLVAELTAATEYEFVVRAASADETVFVDSERTTAIATLPVAEVVEEQPAPIEDVQAPAEEPLAPEAEPIDPITEVAIEAPSPAPLTARALAEASPTAPTARVRGGASIEVDWSAYVPVTTPPLPGYDMYTVTVYLGDTDTFVTTVSGARGTTSVSVSGLENSTGYSFEVQEMSTEVSSGRSAVYTTLADSVLPGVIPGVASAEAQSASEMLVAWPAFVDGVDVRAYTVRAYLDGALVQTKVNLNPFVTGTTTQFATLRANTNYTFTVTVLGYDGDGAESSPSAPVRTLAGAPLAPTAPVLTRTNPIDTDVTATWAAPANDGGYPVTSYVLDFYNTASRSTANHVQTIAVPATSLSYTYEDPYIVGGAFGFVVTAVNAAGSSAVSAMSPALTVAATTTPSALVRDVVASAPTDDGFTATWTVPAGATDKTGYIARVVEQLPGNFASGANYTRKVIDLGAGFAASGKASAVLAALDGATRYRVAITAYEVSGQGDRGYRVSSARSAEITTTGSGLPSKPVSAAPKPVALGIDSVSWAGPVLDPAYSAGSPITGYSIALFENGGATAVQTVEVGASELGPQYVFEGLERGTLYQVRYAGINANGIGAYSDISAGVSTLLVPAPGTVAPEYTTLAQLESAITRGSVSAVTAASLGLKATIESNSPIAFDRAWTGAAENGEVWLYSKDAEVDFQDIFAIAGGMAKVDFELGDLATGTYYLALFAGMHETNPDKPLVVKISVTKPVTGPTELDDAVFRWGINNESNNGAFAGGCNYFVAGKAPDVGAAQYFTASRYSAVNGNVEIVKPNASGSYERASWSTKCLSRFGEPVTTSVNSAFTESQIVITGGTGTVDPSTNSGTIQWDGDFSVVYYGGLTYWYASDPKLVVENGVGRVTVTASGFGADMNDLEKWEAIAEQEITIASLTNVRMTSDGFTVTPDYLGVKSESTGGAFAPQADRTLDNSAYWGSFPNDFISFQEKTGQVAYWYTSAGSQDRAKPTLPLYVGYDASNYTEPDPGAGGGNGGGVVTPPVVEEAPPVQPLNPGGPPVVLADGAQTSVDSLEALLALVADGTVTRVDAAAAGIPATFARGERLDFSFPWSGEDTEGVIWIYPELLYAGTFTVTDGRVTVSLDSSVLEGDGERFFTFFGNAGTTVTVASTASGEIEPAVFTASTRDTRDAEVEETAQNPLPAVRAESPVLLWVIIGFGVVIILAVGAGLLLVRRSRASA